MHLSEGESANGRSGGLQDEPRGIESALSTSASENTSCPSQVPHLTAIEPVRGGLPPVREIGPERNGQIRDVPGGVSDGRKLTLWRRAGSPR
jgi:hypothetical protein